MSVHATMRKVLLTAQIFGFMPVRDISRPAGCNLKYSWRYWKIIYALLTLVGITFMTFIQLRAVLTQINDMVDVYKLVSYIGALCTSITFITLAREWSQIMKAWNVVERSMVGYGVPTGLNKKVNWILIIFLTLLMFRYIFTQLHQLIKATQCRRMAGGGDVFQYFLKRKFGNVCNVFGCGLFSGILLLYVNVQIIFSHTFVDIFVMVISESLASRLHQVTKKIKSTALAEICSEDVWTELREDYNRIERLCKTVNSHISNLVVLSFVRNLIMILIQLFNSLKVRRSFIESFYFYYTFGFLVIRTAFVCILGSAVNDESQRSLTYLYNVPDTVYNKEVDRLIRQVSMSNVALSGLNFFRIKRDLVLKIAGALVTYELILIQFAGNFLKTDVNNNGTSCSL
nr:gustatory receptor [Semanotus bifasciatus]